MSIWLLISSLLFLAPALCSDVNMNSNQFDEQLKDRGHINEDLERVAGKKLEDMSSEEVQFHYFKLHDYDQNNKLDGLEIMSAMTHYTRESEDRSPPISEAQLTEMVDQVLTSDDRNADGFVDYTEFVKSHRSAGKN